MSNIALFGGSFDPIHIGHLNIAEYVRSELNLDKIIFIPNGNHPQKSDLTDAKIRFEMCKNAVFGNKYFEVSSVELDEFEKHYTIDTVSKILKSMNLSKLYFIVGADAIYEIETWYKYKELFNLVEFIVVTRESLSDEKLLYKIDDLIKKYNAEITLMKPPKFEVSSSMIREYVRKNRSIKYLTVDNVISAIKEYNLYES